MGPAVPEAGGAATERARETVGLLVRYRGHGDLAARDALVERFMPVVRRLARRYSRDPESLEDLVQVGAIGLLKAIDRFDLDRGSAFASFALPTIAGELKRHLRDASWALHVPRGMQEWALRVDHAVERLTTERGRSPSIAEVAAQMGVSSEQVLEGLAAGNAYATLSLDATRPAEVGEGAGYAETLGHEDEGFELAEYSVDLALALARLQPRERAVLAMRFEGEMTQAEIGSRIGISQMHVSRLIRRALARLREDTGDDQQREAV